MSEKPDPFYKRKKIYLTIGGLIVGGILFLLALDNIIMPAYTNYGEGVTVPDVTRVSLENAQQTLSASGLRYEVAERRSNQAYPENYVIDQDPTPSEIVKPNRKIYLTVNVVSNPTVKVPKVTDLSLRNARIQLENAGLKMGTISYESSRFRNTVLRQSMEPNTTVDKGVAVDLVVSDGLGENIVQVPDIIGKRLTEGQQLLRQNGLRIGEIRFRPTRDQAPNVILDYSPRVKEITEGRSLQLIVSERYDAQEQNESGAVMDSADVSDSGPSSP